jgi:hypothetical protein
METTKFPPRKLGDSEPAAEEEQESKGKLYPTQDEQQRYHELKAKYGFRDASVVKGQTGKYESDALRSAR